MQLVIFLDGPKSPTRPTVSSGSLSPLPHHRWAPIHSHYPKEAPLTHPAWLLTICTVSTPPSWTASPHCPIPSSRPGFWGSASPHRGKQGEMLMFSEVPPQGKT